MGNRRLLVVIVFAIAISLLGCGVDGDDGRSYIAYSWTGTLNHVYSEDPAFGSVVYNGKFERATPGRYYMDYIAWNDIWYWAEYTITVNEGEDGELFSDGDDGDDLYFDLFLASYGPQIYVSSNDDSERVDALSVLTSSEGTLEEERYRVAEAGISTSGSVQMEATRSGDVNRMEHEPLVRNIGNYTIVVRAGLLE